MNNAWNKLIPYFARQRRLRHIASLLNFDVETFAPPKAIEEENDLLSEIESQDVAILKDPEFIALVKEAGDDAALNSRQRVVIQNLLKNIRWAESMTVEEFIDYNKAISKCTEVWRKAKNDNDFAAVLPYLEKVVDLQRANARKLMGDQHKTPYDVLLDRYEPGNNESIVEGILFPVRDFLIDTLPATQKNHSPNNVPPLLPHSEDEQRHLAFSLLHLEGFDFTRGNLATSEHPFTDWPGRDDFRVTTHYHVEDWRSSLYSVLHEGGHAIHAQCWPSAHYDDFADSLATSAICETHSRFFENIIGRNRDFVSPLLSLCKEHLKGEFIDMSEERFYAYISSVCPSLIRTESDEFTYNIHIVIRYELERDLIDGRIECKDLPTLWNQKYQRYLGIEVPTDREGVLQDTHWFSGLFGYFPSYALGNIYGAQLFAFMSKSIDVASCMRAGNLKPIVNWIKEHDACYDHLPPEEWIAKVTGSHSDPRYFLDYLSAKYLG